MQQTENGTIHYPTWKFVLQISVLQYGIHTTKQTTMLLMNQNWKGDVSYRIGHLKVLHI